MISKHLFMFNPNYALELVMKVTNTIKTSVCVDFLLAIIVNYGNNKKSSKRLCLKYLKTVIEFNCLIWVKQGTDLFRHQNCPFFKLLFMNSKSSLIIILFILFLQGVCFSQVVNKSKFPSSGWLSFGMRSTLSTFDGDGNGLGYGGQFQIKLSSRVNTDWFGDYISINVSDKVRSEYYHIGWSVVYYPFEQYQYPRLLQPYILAGHCFDYNKKTEMANSSNSKDRWGRLCKQA